MKWFVPRLPKSDDSHCHHFFNSDDHFFTIHSDMAPLL
jgi:hypothetical protein